jgi:hypothetical protein
MFGRLKYTLMLTYLLGGGLILDLTSGKPPAPKILLPFLWNTRLFGTFENHAVSGRDPSADGML